MKKVLLSIVSGVLLSIGAYAQDGIEIYEYGQSTDVSGDTLEVTAPNNDVFDVIMEIHNNTGSTVTWKITRRRLDVPTGWADGLCWGHCTDLLGGTCYSSDQMTGDLWTSSANSTILFDIPDGECGKLKPQINPDDYVSGVAQYRYYMRDLDNYYIDSVDVKVDFTASVKQIKEEVSVALHPNPASDFVTINLNNSESGTIKIVDVLGNVIMRDAISGSKKVDLDNFRNGVYFIMIEVPGSKAINRKLIVRH